MNKFAYKINFYDECNECDECEYGMIVATNYANAVEKLSEYYGENNLYNLEIECLESDSPCIIIPKDSFESICAVNSF